MMTLMMLLEPALTQTPRPTTPSLSVSAEVADGHVRLRGGEHEAVLHPQWLRGRSTEPGQVEATNRQRLFTPIDIPADLRVATVDVVVRDALGLLDVTFSDGHRAHLDLGDIDLGE